MPYRKKFNFTFDGLNAAATAIDRLRNYKLRVETDKFASGLNENIIERTKQASAAFDEALDDDLNTAGALGAVFEYLLDTNSAMDAGAFLAGNVPAALEFLDRFDSVFDVLRPTAKLEVSPMLKSTHWWPSATRLRNHATSSAPIRSARISHHKASSSKIRRKDALETAIAPAPQEPNEI